MKNQFEMHISQDDMRALLTKQLRMSHFKQLDLIVVNVVASGPNDPGFKVSIRPATEEGRKTMTNYHLCKRCGEGGYLSCNCKPMGRYWTDGEEVDKEEDGTEFHSRYERGDPDEHAARIGERLNEDDSEWFENSAQEIEIRLRLHPTEEEPNPQVQTFRVLREWNPIFSAYEAPAKGEK